MASEGGGSVSVPFDSTSMSIRKSETIEKRSKKNRRQTKSEYETTDLKALSNQTVEERALYRLKAKLQPLVKGAKYGKNMDVSDTTLKRWLLATNNNVIHAAGKIQRHEMLKWKLGLINITGDYKPSKFLFDYYAGGLCGEDREGSPVYYELFGIIDIRGIIMSVQKKELLTFKMFQHELIKEYLKVLSKEKGKDITNILVVIDMIKCTRDTLWGPSLRIWAEIIELLQENYPRLVKEVLVIHPPTMFAEIYLSLRPYMKPSTLELIKVFGNNYFKYLEQRIPRHYIPAYLGGYKCDFDNNQQCFEDLNWVEQVPQWLYLMSSSIQARAQEFNILAGAKHVEEYMVTLRNSLLSWEFYHISQPLFFAVYIDTISDKTCTFKKENMSQFSKKRNHTWNCKVPGRYLMVFDNCKDHAFNVRITCNIAVLPPADIPLYSFNKTLGDSIKFNLPMDREEVQMRRRLGIELPSIVPNRVSQL
ncbi:retinal-binding protein [Biomphalaria pfeifferi]|uniref:Retinal-binding protein n=1 Tax=Biomphalaria pfeifferi TaxID=112525 RepID=A0AAD8AU73_BIOPF|nr:retinal-binding protein [Biomphalaria pfeifferi]